MTTSSSFKAKVPTDQRTVRLQKAMQAIKEAKDSGSSKLLLSGLGLTSDDVKALIPKLKEISGLNSLCLSHNQLTTLPQELEELSTLRILDLEKNQLEIFPRALLSLRDLRGLNLNNNVVNALPEDLNKLKHLRFLNLENNALTTLPVAIGALRKMVLLGLTNNKLTAFPEDLAKLKNLEVLSLSQNAIGVLPECLGDLVNLVVLEAEEAKITKLPQSLGNLISIEALNLKNNELTSLPDKIHRLNPLLSLQLEFNKLPGMTLERLNTSFPYSSLPIETDTQAEFCARTHALEQIYGDQSDEVFAKIRGIDFGDFPVGDDKMYNSELVLLEFLEKLPVDHVHASVIYNRAAKELLDVLIDENLSIEKRKLTLQKIATYLGDCDTPVKLFLTHTFVFQCLDKERDIPNEVQDVLLAMAVEQAIKTKLKAQLKGPEAMEQVAALLHSLFWKNAAIAKCNKVKILGTQVSLPPFSRYVKFGFIQIPEELAAAFAKMCCQEKDGQLIQEHGKYLLDPKKINAMVEPFLADLGLVSKREGLVRDYKEKIRGPLLAHDLISFPDKKDVLELLNMLKHQEKLRALLQDVADDKIEEVAIQFFEKKELKIKTLGMEYKQKASEPTKDLSQLTTTSNNRQISSNRAKPVIPKLGVTPGRRQSMN